MTARVVCCVLAGLLSLSAQAQLRDPTEPPAALRQAGERAAGADAAAPAATAPQLQSVLISRKRRIAVIDGETVRVGQRHRGALVASIAPTQVVLQRGSTREVLRLYPADPSGPGTRQR
jgi:MSHA biogenesis protein MshK